MNKDRCGPCPLEAENLIQERECGRLNNGFQDVHILILGTYEYITIHEKKNFVDIIKLKTLRWRDYSGLSGWAQYNHMPYKREAEGDSTREDNKCED